MPDADLTHENQARKRYIADEVRSIAELARDQDLLDRSPMLRSMWVDRRAQVQGMNYEAFRTLAEARTRPGAIAALDLDAEPFQPLATFPAGRIEADESALGRLHAALGAALAAAMQPEEVSTSGRVRYETGAVLDDKGNRPRGAGLCLHEGLRALELEGEVEAVFLGLRPDLDPDLPDRILRRREWWWGVAQGDHEVVRGLLGQGFPVGAVQGWGWPALTIAARREDIAMVRLLLERGADPNQADSRGATPTTAAAWRAGLSNRGVEDEILGLMLAAGGRLGLREAVMLGDVDLARRILDADPTIDVSGDAGCHHAYSFLMIAAEFGRRDLVELLLDRGADVHGTDDDIHYTALCVAASGGYADIAALLLGRGADPNHASAYGFTPLAYAAEHGHADVVRLLLDRGVRRTLADAVFMNDAKLVAGLLATAEKEDHTLDSILFSCRSHIACCGIDVLRLLLDAWPKSNGWWLDTKLLSEVAAAGRRDVVQLLLEHGFDPGKPDDDGATPAEHAERAGHAEVAGLLRAAARAFRPDDSPPSRRGRG